MAGSAPAPARGRVPPPVAGRRYFDVDRGVWMIRPGRGKAVPLHSPEGEKVSGRRSSFDAGQALRRAGLATRQEARAQGRLVSKAGSAVSSRTPAVGLGGFVLYLGFSLLGLIVLDVALRGRGPAGVKLALDYAGSFIRRLVSPGDPIFGATPVLAAAAPSAGAAGTGTRSGASPRITSGDYAFGTRTLEKEGYDVIGIPYQGTHAPGANRAGVNWESNNAVDVGLKRGTPLYAAFSGTIGSQFGTQPTRPNDGMRLHLVGGADELFYAHLSSFAPGIAPGVRVKAGQLIGYSGASENGAAHLHLGSARATPFAYVLQALRGG